MLAQNQVAKTSDLFVLHARKPAFIARVNPTGDKGKFTLELIEVYQDAEKEDLEKILKQMREWYYSTHINKKTV
ncbi:hypothetical protein Dfri01_39220 [Dyadobacter frigoris]|nr:hypothetical protein Dfri01_39220 [Dyadobacter frigoris]